VAGSIVGESLRHFLYVSSRRKVGAITETHHSSCVLAGADWICLGSGQGGQAGEIELRAEGVARDHAVFAWDGKAWTLHAAKGPVHLERTGRNKRLKPGDELFTASNIHPKRLRIGDHCVISITGCGAMDGNPLALKLRVESLHHRFFPEAGTAESVIVAPEKSRILLLEAVEGLPGAPALAGYIESEKEGRWSYAATQSPATVYPKARRLQPAESVPIVPKTTVLIRGSDGITHDLFCDDPEFRLKRRIATAPGRAKMPNLLPGSLVDTYMLLARLGEGVCGAVWLAREIGPGAQAGLRVLKLVWRDHERELEAWRRLQNDNVHGLPRVLQVVDMGEGVGYVVLFHTPGRDLANALSRRRFGVYEFLHMVTDVASGGLAPLHAAGYVHGDMKPANILLLDDGHAQLMDFGGLGHAGAKRRQFSRHYVPPEVKEAPDKVPLEPDQDVFAFAQIIREMLGAGSEPVAWDLLGAGDQEAQAGRLPPRVRMAPLLRSLLKPSLSKATAPAQKRRYQNAGEFLRGARFNLWSRPLMLLVPMALSVLFMVRAEMRREDFSERLARVQTRGEGLDDSLDAAPSLRTIREDIQLANPAIRLYLRAWGVPGDVARSENRIADRVSAGLRSLIASVVDSEDLEPEEKMKRLQEQAGHKLRMAVELAGFPQAEADRLLREASETVLAEAERRTTKALTFAGPESVRDWRPIQNWEMKREDRGVRAVGHAVVAAAESGGGEAGCLELTVQMDPASGNPADGKGEAAFDMRRLELLGMQMPADMRNCRISVEFRVRGNLEGPSEFPNGIQVLAIDREWRRFYGPWVPMRNGAEWALCEALLSNEAPIGGWVDPEFNPAAIVYLGVKVGLSREAEKAVSGAVLIRSYAFDVRPPRPKSATPKSDAGQPSEAKPDSPATAPPKPAETKPKPPRRQPKITPE